MFISKELLPIASTSDDNYVYYKKNGDFDGVFILDEQEILISLSDFFAKRTDIVPIEDSEQTRKIWKELRKEMGVDTVNSGDMFVKIAKRPDKFDPDAVDADNDGRVQDGTPFERPTTPRVANRLRRRVNGKSPDRNNTTDVDSDEFRRARQEAVQKASARGEGLKKAARRMFSGRQRSATQRRKLIDGSAFNSYPGIRRMFKSRDDAYADLKESALRTISDMKQRAANGTLTGKPSIPGMPPRQLDKRVVEYFANTSAEKIWEDLEKAAFELHKSVEKMPIETRTHIDVAERIINEGLLGDPSNRTKRLDSKTPWIIQVLSENNHSLSEEDIRVLEMNGLSVKGSGRGDIYESLREVLEQAMGFNGAGDRNGRPVYGYFVTPSPRTTEEIGRYSEVGKRLADRSNGPNLVGYSDSSLVRLRDSVKSRTGYTYGDSLRNGILPRRIGDGDDKDTVLAVVHDKDFTDTKIADAADADDIRKTQDEYLLNLLEWRLMGDSSNLTRQDYIEAAIPYDVSPDEIEEMVIATDRIKIFRNDFDEVRDQIIAASRAAKMGQQQHEALLTFLINQDIGWENAIKTSGASEVSQFAQIDSLLKSAIQLNKGNKLREAGESRGIKMTVGPTFLSNMAGKPEPQTLEDAIAAIIERFNQ